MFTKEEDLAEMQFVTHVIGQEAAQVGGRGRELRALFSVHARARVCGGWKEGGGVGGGPVGGSTAPDVRTGLVFRVPGVSGFKART